MYQNPALLKTLADYHVADLRQHPHAETSRPGISRIVSPLVRLLSR